MMRRFVLTLNVLFLTGLATVCGCGRPAKGGEEHEPEALAAVRAVRAEGMTLRPSVSLVGTLAAVPERTVELSTPVEGQVKRLCVEEGQDVRAGDELIVLDDRQARAALAKAQGALAEAQSALALLRQGAHPHAIEAARHDLKKTEATARSLKQKLDALAPLRENHEVSDVRYQQAAAECSAAQAEKEAAAARLKLLEAGARPEEIAEAEAKAASAKAEVDARELAVDFCSIKSPIDGVVTQLPVRQGMYVAPPATLATIVDLSTLFAQVRIPATHLAQVKTSAQATVEVPSVPDGELKGAVARIGKEADAQTGDVSAFVSVPNANGNLRPGLACRVRVALPEIPNAVAVPAAAVSDNSGVPVVTLVRDGKAYETEVQLGGHTPGFVQVLDGVAPGDLVAVEGGYGLPHGCPVSLRGDAE